jgi:phenylacetate-coenzyme A ligase PaaK-like adenylate-forming protein
MIMSAKEQRIILQQRIQACTSKDFSEIALDVFRFQATHNPLYQQYLRLLNVDPHLVDEIDQIPFLPIQFFKNHSIQTGSWEPELLFTSSGTGGTTSTHSVLDPNWYLANTRLGFESFYGPLEDYCFLGLLPSYLERTGSSLIYMVDHFIQQSRYPQSGFFLHNTQELLGVVEKCQEEHIPTVLIGVSFALLDLAEQAAPNLQGLVVMETGGMKGRRREITRTELHDQLSQAFQVDSIHSEYGMTELFSQAYSKGKGLFACPPTMQVLTREITDPFSPALPGKAGVLNIIDLANLDTISFIGTQDLGRVHSAGQFEVLGRLDNSDVRGCNLMVAD